MAWCVKEKTDKEVIFNYKPKFNDEGIHLPTFEEFKNRQ